TFADLETEMFPTWLDSSSPETLGTNMPPWWASVLKGKYSVSPAAQPLPTIIRGPYLQLGTTNSMVVRWRTDLPTSYGVSYGTAPTRMNRNARANGVFTEHAVQITNLTAGTKYFYGLGPTDTPLFVRITNDIAFISSTNSRIYVNKPGTREQIAVANRDTFVVMRNKKRFTVTDLEKSFVDNIINNTLVVNTPNNAVLLTISNNAIAVVTSNHVRWLDGG